MLYAISKQIATVYIEICIFGWYRMLNIPIEKKYRRYYKGKNNRKESMVKM